jgi:hypothetical protein
MTFGQEEMGGSLTCQTSGVEISVQARPASDFDGEAFSAESNDGNDFHESFWPVSALAYPTLAYPALGQLPWCIVVFAK